MYYNKYFWAKVLLTVSSFNKDDKTCTLGKGSLTSVTANTISGYMIRPWQMKVQGIKIQGVRTLKEKGVLWQTGLIGGGHIAQMVEYLTRNSGVGGVRIPVLSLAFSPILLHFKWMFTELEYRDNHTLKDMLITFWEMQFWTILIFLCCKTWYAVGTGWSIFTGTMIRGWRLGWRQWKFSRKEVSFRSKWPLALTRLDKILVNLRMLNNECHLHAVTFFIPESVQLKTTNLLFDFFLFSHSLWKLFSCR